MMTPKQREQMEKVAKLKEENQGYEYDIYTDLNSEVGGVEGIEEGALPDCP